MKKHVLKSLGAAIALAGAFLAPGAQAGEYDDLTVPSKAGVNEISASASSLAGPAGAFASDSDSNSRFATKATSVTLQYRFIDGSIPVVTNFSLMPPKQGGTAYAPREISLYGSNTGESSDWALLTEVKGLTWTADTERKYFPFENQKPYLWYKWAFKNPSGGTYIGCQSVQLFGFKVEDDALYIIGEPFFCGSVTPDYSLRSGLSEGDKISCSASGESFYYAGGDFLMTAKGWKLYCITNGLSGFEVADEADEIELEYSHQGKKRVLAWQFDAQPCVVIAAAEHGSAAADKSHYTAGKYATVTATADTGYGFAYWTGDVPDADKYDNPLLLRMDAPKHVTPVFLPAKTVTPGGEETPQQAINSLGADGGVLFMEEGTYTYATTAPALYLTTPVIVRGAGRGKTVIDGQAGKMRAVTIDNANAAVIGVTVTNCVGGTSQGGDSMGSGLFFTANGGRFLDGAVIGCKNSSCNGAIAMKGGRVSRSIIRANTSSIGGGIYMDNTSVPVVDNCLIAGNAANDQGGAIYFCGGTLLNCTIVNNRETASGQYGGGGGVCLMSGAARTIYNCIFSDNRATKTGGGAPDWYATTTAQGQTVDFRNNAMENNLYKSQNPISGVTFVADTDWIPSSASATKDAGAVHSKQSSRDLIGKLRVSGDAIDAGCYEFDDNVVGCSFAADPALVSTNGVTTLKAKVSGVEDETDLTFEWTVSNKTTDVVSSASGKNADLVEPDEGWYAVTLRVLRGGEEVANYFDGECLRVVPNEIVLSDGDDLSAAVARADNGTKIVLGDGTYEIAKTVALNRPMTIVSASGLYSSVTVSVTTATTALSFDCQQATVEDVTIIGPVAMATHGGTLAGCRVTGCYGGRGQSAPVSASANSGVARITRCRIENNGVAPNGTISRNTIGAVSVGTGAQLDSCLIAHNYSQYDSKDYTHGGTVSVSGDPSVLNCTIVDNNDTTYCGFFCYSTGSYDIRNCLLARNVSPSSAAGQPNFFCPESSFAANAKNRIVNCHFGLAKSREIVLTAKEIYGETGFVNPTEGDYRLGPQSCCRDAGSKMSATVEQGTDLAGNPRVSGDAIDIGCYESDANLVGFTFAAVPAVATTASNVVFTATVVGGDLADYDFSWTITNTRTGEEMTGTGSELTLTEPAEGLYTGVMAVTKDGQPVDEIPIEGCLKVVPTRIDLADGDDLEVACARADEGTEIVLGVGTYPLGKMQTFKSGVTVRSANGRYADAIITVTNAVIAFKLDHARARVQDITVKGPVLIDINGGTLSGCRVTGCYGNRGQSVPVYTSAGTVTHCLIDHNGLNPSGAVSRNTVGGVLLASSTTSMENCLIANNYGGSSDNRHGAVTIINAPRMWNCTIAGNDNAGIGGLYCYSSGDYDIRNCVVAGNTSTSTADGQPNLHCIQQDNFATSAREHIVNCHFGLETPRASAMTKDEVYGETLLKSPERGNYRLMRDSCCRDAGVSMPSLEPGTDLDGNPRVSKYGGTCAIDLGCYESQSGRALRIIVR